MSTAHFCYIDKNGDLVQINVPDNKLRVKSDSRGRYAKHISGDWKVYPAAKEIVLKNGDTYNIISMGSSQSADPYGRNKPLTRR